MTQTLEAHMGVSDARANLTDVISRVRLLQQRVVLTRRDKTQAVLVSAEFYEAALAALGDDVPTQESVAAAS